MLSLEKSKNGLSSAKLFPRKVVSALLIGLSLVSTSVSAEVGEPEKDELTFGFIKLTDMAPIAIAYENGYFEDEGLYVTIEAQANWKVLLDGVIDGKLDGAHMLAGQPLAATIGYGTEAHIVTPFSMDLNGNGITVSNDIWERMKEHVPAIKCAPCLIRKFGRMFNAQINMFSFSNITQGEPFLPLSAPAFTALFGQIIIEPAFSLA